MRPNQSLAVVPLAVLVGLALPLPLLAATYSASASNGTPQTSTDGSAVSSSGSIGLVVLPGGLNGSQDASAAAGPGGLRASSQAHITGSFQGLASGLMGASASASGSWDDLVITGPAGDPVPISLNLQLTGTFTTGAILSDNWANSGRAAISVDVSGSIAGHPFAGSYQQAKEGYPPPVGSMQITSSGVFGTAGQLPVNFTSPGFSAPVGAPFSLSLQLIAGASASYSIFASSGPGPHTMDLLAQSHFDNTLRFPIDGPVFVLPSGYTIHSPSAGIIDNRFVIPEPSTAVLALVAGLLSAVWPLRRRLRHN